MGPVTALGRVAVPALIFFGLAIFAVTFQQSGLFAMRKREQHTEWLITRLRNEPDSTSKDTNQESDG